MKPIFPMLPRTLYLPAHPQAATWLQTFYCEPDGLARREIAHLTYESDESEDYRSRTSPDNGRTWSAFEPMPGRTWQLPGGGRIDYPWRPYFAHAGRLRLDAVMRRLWPGLKLNTYDWTTGNHPLSDHVLVQENGGPEILLKYEEGPDYNPHDIFNPDFHSANRAYAGQGFAEGADGTVYFPLVCPGRTIPKQGGVILMRREPATGCWTASNRIDVAPEISPVGLEEPDVAVLRDGTVIVVCRTLRTAQTPPRKWMSVSTDGGRTLSPPAPVTYDDGTAFPSPHSIHYFFRSTRNGRLYWILNVGADTDDELGGPRYPLVIAEWDEARSTVRKGSLTTVDDRRPGEPQALQLSNFCPLENRETLDLEIYITRIGENPERFWSAGVYRYVFSPPG